jgi:hypothetical protein
MPRVVAIRRCPPDFQQARQRGCNAGWRLPARVRDTRDAEHRILTRRSAALERTGSLDALYQPLRPLLCRIGGALTPLAGFAASGAPRQCGRGLPASAQPPKPPKGFKVGRQSRCRRPDRSARRPRRAEQWQRGAAVSGRQAAPGLGGVPPSASLLPPNPPRRGALDLAALLAVRRLLGLQPCGLPLPARAATSAPPRRWPPSDENQTTRRTLPGSVASASPPRGLGKRWQPAALRSARCISCIPPPALAIPVGRLRPWGPPQRPWWARRPSAP